MKAWLHHRIRAESIDEVHRSLEHYAKVVRRPNSGHVYNQATIRILEVDEQTGQIAVAFAHAYLDQPAFWDAYRTEQDILDVIWERRRNLLFALPHLRSVDEQMEQLINVYRGRYQLVWDRQAERSLLGHCRDECRLLFDWVRSHTPPPARYETAEGEWQETCAASVYSGSASQRAANIARTDNTDSALTRPITSKYDPHSIYKKGRIERYIDMQRLQRKSLSRISADMGAYVTGRAEISMNPPPGDLPYPIDWRYMLTGQDAHFAPFDASGLPMKVFPGSSETHYLPSRMASWALAHWTRLHNDGGGENRRRFLQAADWFADQPNGLYFHRYGMANIGVTRPWLSALAQGQAVSVLARANALTGNERYLDIATCAVAPLTTSFDDGGVASTLGGAGPFLEEYPDRGGTLNGCLLAVVGLDDLIESGAGGQVIDLRDSVIETVAAQATSWERNGWSLYSHAPADSAVVPNFNTMRYHCIHVRLLDHFAGRTGDQRLTASAERTKAALDRVGLRLNALAMKTRYRLRSGW